MKPIDGQLRYWRAEPDQSGLGSDRVIFEIEGKEIRCQVRYDGNGKYLEINGESGLSIEPVMGNSIRIKPRD